LYIEVHQFVRMIQLRHTISMPNISSLVDGRMCLIQYQAHPAINQTAYMDA